MTHTCLPARVSPPGWATGDTGEVARHARVVAVVLAAVVALAGAGAGLVALRGTDDDGRARDAGWTGPCAGSTTLCDRRLDQVAFAATHNSMNAAADGFGYPDQQQGIEAQLAAGVRGFLVDAYLGSVRTVDGEDLVHTDITTTSRANLLLQATHKESVRRALELRRRAGAPADDAPREIYLCHQFCELGAEPMSVAVETWRQFLEDHPDEVLVVVIQDEMPADALRPALDDLAPYLATLDPAGPLPTLREMLTSGRRLVVGLENGDLGPDLPNVFTGGLLQEVPYTYRRASSLESAASCRRNRGSRDAPLLLLNHWVTPASEDAAARVNGEDVLGARIDRCTRLRGQQVNLVAVDFFESGDLVPVVADRNR
jgi:hypothetical protein